MTSPLKNIICWKNINLLFRKYDFVPNRKRSHLCPGTAVGGAWNPVLWAICPGMPGGARARYIDSYNKYNNYIKYK